MKKIAITQRLIGETSYNEVRDALDIKWADLFSMLNYLPVILPTNFDFIKYFNNFDIDGIIFSGGNDLHIFNPTELSYKRDKFEKDLLQYAINKNIPVFGVCRGMQIIGDFFGAEFVLVENHVAVNHKIVISNDSKLFNMKSFSDVNSFHKYAIKKISDEFIISAKSEDNVIEAIEHKNYRIFAQMWHPEREEPFNENDINMIKKFFGG